MKEKIVIKKEIETKPGVYIIEVERSAESTTNKTNPTMNIPFNEQRWKEGYEPVTFKGHPVTELTKIGKGFCGLVGLRQDPIVWDESGKVMNEAQNYTLMLKPVKAEIL